MCEREKEREGEGERQRDRERQSSWDNRGTTVMHIIMNFRTVGTEMICVHKDIIQNRIGLLKRNTN